jgi:branched-chain amino acid transport system ATP-binding protein
MCSLDLREVEGRCILAPLHARFICSFLQQSAITTIFVEHDMDVVQRYSQRVLVFNDGKVIADGPPASVLAYPEVRKAVLGQE